MELAVYLKRSLCFSIKLRYYQ